MFLFFVFLCVLLWLFSSLTLLLQFKFSSQKNKANFIILFLGKKQLLLVEVSQDREGHLTLLRKERRTLTLELSSQTSSFEEITQYLQEILAVWNLEKVDLHCLLSSELVFYRVAALEIPSQNNIALTDFIKIEAGNIIPATLEEVVWDYQLLDTSLNNKQDVAYAAAKKEFLEGLNKGIISAGGSLQSITITQNLYSCSTEAVKNFVAPVLGASSMLYTLNSCAPSTSCSSSASATINIGSHSSPNNLFDSILSEAVSITNPSSNRINLLPPSVRAKQRYKQRFPYFVAAISLLLFLMCAGSLSLSSATKRITIATAQTTLLLEEKKKQERQLEYTQRELYYLKEQEEQLLQLMQARNAWPLLIKELQTRIPERYLWITELSPLPNEVASINALEIKGLYLENPNQAQVVDHFMEQLQQSPLFLIDQKNRDEILRLRTTPDGSSYAYPFTLQIPLRTPITGIITTKEHTEKEGRNK